ncbi:MAG: hypothetical protein IKF90_05310 [Parasporobacterium sp.]|nr:hypothetical protein [Parasporobacterium sp.]
MVEIGKQYPTNNCGMVTVLSKEPNQDIYTVQFLNTGTIKETRGFQILDGCIRDPYAPLLCGVACTGNISTKREYKPFYSIWHDMINRCYNPKDKRYKTKILIDVCDEWLIFENFYNDMSKIEGYDYDRIVNGELVLDKDIKQKHSKHKTYSINTCVWVDKKTNCELQDSQQKRFIATDPNGTVYKDYNVSRFAREHDINKQNVFDVLRGRRKQYEGWKFFYEEIV